MVVVLLTIEPWSCHNLLNIGGVFGDGVLITREAAAGLLAYLQEETNFDKDFVPALAFNIQGNLGILFKFEGKRKFTQSILEIG